MKKKVLFIFFCLFFLITDTCMCAVVYPQNTEQNEPVITERINIVFDNSGHDYVKRMFLDDIAVASFYENADVWLYPIAGSADPIKLEANKDFMDENFVSYSKSSNEYKDENVLERAISDLNSDTSVTTKRLVLHLNNNIEYAKDEYTEEKLEEYVHQNSGIIFSLFSPSGRRSIMSSRALSLYENVNYNKSISEYFLQQLGYSECVADYNKEEGYIKIIKGQADANLYVIAEGNRYIFEKAIKKGIDPGLFLGGCMLNQEGFAKYQKSNKVKGVALSYNQIGTESNAYDNPTMSALYTADEVFLNPAEEDLYIPLINASSVKVYSRSIKGIGICSADTVYDAKLDKEIINIYAPKDSNNSDTSQNTGITQTTSETSVWGSIKGFLLGILYLIIRLLYLVIYLGSIVLFFGLIFSQRLRNFVHLKIMGSKFEPIYDKISNMIIKLINDFKSSDIKVKGTVIGKGNSIFISKASADLKLKVNLISLVVSKLEKRGIQCWMSENSIGGAEDFNEVIPTAIDNSVMVLCFLTPNSINSKNVETEVSHAKGSGKPIFPLQISKFDVLSNQKWKYILNLYQIYELYTFNEKAVDACVRKIETEFIRNMNANNNNSKGSDKRVQ